MLRVVVCAVLCVRVYIQIQNLRGKVKFKNTNSTNVERIRQVSFSQRSGFVGGVGWLYECRLVSTYEVMGRDNCGKVIFQ